MFVYGSVRPALYLNALSYDQECSHHSFEEIMESIQGDFSQVESQKINPAFLKEKKALF